MMRVLPEKLAVIQLVRNSLKGLLLLSQEPVTEPTYISPPFHCYLFILTANGFLPVGSGTTIRHKTTNSVAWVRERTIPTERPPLVGEASANFCAYRVPRGQRDGSLLSVFLDF
jgi:hypothetical protein